MSEHSEHRKQHSCCPTSQLPEWSVNAGVPASRREDGLPVTGGGGERRGDGGVGVGWGGGWFECENRGRYKTGVGKGGKKATRQKLNGGQA